MRDPRHDHQAGENQGFRGQMPGIRYQVSGFRMARGIDAACLPGTWYLFPVSCFLAPEAWNADKSFDVGTRRCCAPYAVPCSLRVVVSPIFPPAGKLLVGLGAIKPIERLVLVSCTRCRASTSSLSTWWSSTALKRDLVSRGVSRLDAFSGYPVRT